MPKVETVGQLYALLADVPFGAPIYLQLTNDPEEVDSIELESIDVVKPGEHPAGPMLLLNLHVSMVGDDEDEEDDDD